MKRTLLVLVLVTLAASSIIKECTSDGKNQKCSMEEKPVCGIQGEGDQQKKETYANHCLACSSGKTDFTVEKRCEDYSEQAIFCSPKETQNKICTDEFDKQCGYMITDTCQINECYTYSQNRCKACSSSDVVFTVAGYCPNTQQTNVTI